MSSFARTYLEETVRAVQGLDREAIDAVAAGLAEVRRRGGRLFVLGVGGSAAHAGHAVNDFRKICGLEAYTPTDNVAELTARVNDEGWATSYSEWLKVSRLGPADGVLVFSVGGGDTVKGISENLVRALELARDVGASIFGIVGRDGGRTRQVAQACVVIPVVNPERITPHTEGLASVVQHLLVSHPSLKERETTWEAAAR